MIPPVVSGPRRRSYAALIAIGFGRACVAVGVLLLVRQGFNHLVRHAAPGAGAAALRLGAVLALLAGAEAWLVLRARVEAERLGQSYTHTLRLTLYERMATLAPRSLQRRNQGVVAMRFVGDLSAVRQWVSLGLARLTVAGISTLGALAALGWINPPLALAVGGTVAIGSLTTYRLGGELRSTARTVRRRRAQLARNVNEKVFAIAAVQAFGQVARERARLRKESRRLREAMIDNARATGRVTAVTTATATLATAVALVVGAEEIANHRATAGTVVAAMSVVGLLVPSVRQLGQVQQYWHNSRVGLAAIERFLETPSLVHERQGAPDLPSTGAGRLEFVDVGFDLIEDVTATAPAGSVVALTGPNGAGKSTLLALAARLIDPERGVVRLDGIDLGERSLESIRAAIGMAGPGLPLTRGTVEMNLRYRWPDAPEEEITRVRELCELDGVLAQLPDGDQTRLAERGGNISEGQRQRIALARALVGSPRLLLLDEVDAHLDPDAVETVDRVIAAQRGHTTVLVVTHRPEAARSADAIWDMRAGRLTAVELRGPLAAG